MADKGPMPDQDKTMETTPSMGRRHALVALALAAGVTLRATPAGAVSLRVGEPAPEITGEPWINSPPLTMAGLRGRVVFVEFWTYG
jgi:hypothetical protein